MGDMGSTFNGLSGKTKDDFGHGEAKFITYMNVFSNPIADLTMTESIEIDKKQKSVKAGDVFFTTSSETPDEVGMSSVMPEDADNIYLNSFCFGYRPTEKFDLNYLAYVLRADSFRKEMTFLAQGISRYNISKNKVMEVCIPVPTIEEQTKVGRYFRNLDHLITLHQRKLDHVKDLKKSMLQKMFPKNGQLYPEVRFPEFTDAWEQRKLGEISDKVTKKNQDVVVDEVFTNSAEYGIISQRDFFDKDIANTENIDGYYVVEPNDFVYNPRISTTAPFGPIKRNKLERSGAMSPLYYVFRPNNVDLSYLEWFFQTSCWYPFMRFNGNSGARSDRFAITDKIFNEMPISLPQDIEEQKRIGMFLTTLDTLITLHQRKLGAINLTNAIVLFDNGYNPALACELIILKGVLTYAKHHYQKQHVILRLL